MGRVLPILFNGDMVQAVLDGRKTVTRRICRDGNRYTVPDMGLYDAEKRTYAVHRYMDEEHECESRLGTAERPCPICPGDILYVRETWSHIPCIDCRLDEAGICDGEPVTYEDRYSVSEGCFIYRGDYPEQDRRRVCWHPSIHMPKQAASIWLKVKDVRVERLQEIDGRGILAEGIDNGRSNPAMGKRWENMQRMAFSELWDSTIKKTDFERYGWDANPWVWVIRFERCGKPEPCILKDMEPASGNRPCIGYQKSKEDDEPCEMCKGCGSCDGEEPESEG